MKPYWPWITLLISTALSDTASLRTSSPFHYPRNADTVERAFEILQILKRSDICPSGYKPCTNLGNSKVCCKDGTRCSIDAADNIACCPTGAWCTGSLSTSDTGSVFSWTVPATTTTELPGTSAVGSTITGAAYPFPYIPTSFANAETCSSYYNACQSEYRDCIAKLGGQYGVTVSGPSGAGITVPGGLNPTPAVSTCSILSLEACHGLQLPYCQIYGNWRSNAAVRTPRWTSIQDLVFGLAVGVAGMLI